MVIENKIILVCFLEALLQLIVIWISERQIEDVNSSLLVIMIVAPIVVIFQVVNGFLLQFAARNLKKRKMIGIIFTICFAVLFLFLGGSLLSEIIIAVIFLAGNAVILLDGINIKQYFINQKYK